MNAVTQLQRQFVDYFTSLFREGLVDDQFAELQKLQDQSTPDFVAEFVTLFFEDCEKLINNMAKALEQRIVDCQQVDSHVHQLKSSCSRCHEDEESVLCIAFRTYCEGQNCEGCVRCLQQVNHEYFLLKNKLQTLFMKSISLAF
ncbi:putative histidine-containing phosphotransfer protein 4 [Tripterygium wilfordii]|uniref:Histidine-containing phosphotransfer protein n=1 Tax=Tripterygium wilfordii TaxID=458696 RepID=A0A7J7DCU0_TRIWF|nr:putative histidine-containing phosphotransfer protein 4 [Tripterygium wilfordii]